MGSVEKDSAAIGGHESRGNGAMDWGKILHRLEHFLPSQAPLKDFIHHNTLHAFQHLPFFEGIREASDLFGYKTLLPLDEYRKLQREGRIRYADVQHVVVTEKGEETKDWWMDRLLQVEFYMDSAAKVGELRGCWKSIAHIDLDSIVHPLLFRIIGAYLDQGVSTWRFPEKNLNLLAALRKMEQQNIASFFQSKEVKQRLLNNDRIAIADLLEEVVGDENLYERYLYDQQFAHAGYSGMVATIAQQPQTLLDARKVSFEEWIQLELLLELDALHYKFGRKSGGKTPSLSDFNLPEFGNLWDKAMVSTLDEVLRMWHLAYEWSYYGAVLSGIQLNVGRLRKSAEAGAGKTGAKAAAFSAGERHFQAAFCIDDRECSIRRHVEQVDYTAETFGTPGFFGVPFYYRPVGGKFTMKLCPAPVNPKYLVKELDPDLVKTGDVILGAAGKLEAGKAEAAGMRKKEWHFHDFTHNAFFGFFITHTVGFWSAFKLFAQVFFPSMGATVSTSLKHMDQGSLLQIDATGEMEDGLQVGFTLAEMADMGENLLKSIGLTDAFAPIFYFVAHGSSSNNNPHYAAYDCGACSGRPGSVNSRVISYFLNKPAVRTELKNRGILIPEATLFMGALHDTTRDEIVFYDEDLLQGSLKELHLKNKATFNEALKNNAFERSRRFILINKNKQKNQVWEKVKLRSISLFEPRPELNHATNSLCIIGGKELTKGLFLDRRSFLNSYDYRKDPEGKYLAGIMGAAAPVCGGINLEYFFSRVDNLRLGAGTKLPHNVMGLIGVANGIDGDLRPGLPSQMIEVHEPVRLLMVVEQYPQVVEKVLHGSAALLEWFENEWIHLVVLHPDEQAFYVFKEKAFVLLGLEQQEIQKTNDILEVIMKNHENMPVMMMEEAI